MPRRHHLILLPLFLSCAFGGEPKTAGGGKTDAGATNALRAVPTFECMGLYWDVADGSREERCAVRYREKGQNAWREAQDLWYAAKDRQYRGSVVNLRAGTIYEFALNRPGGRNASIEAGTWSNVFPVVSTTVLPPGTLRSTLHITEGGTPDGYRLYTAAPEGTTVDVLSKEDTCIRVEADYVIVRGVKCVGARVDGLRIANRRHVVIEGCDISEWGRPDQKAGQTIRLGNKDFAIPANLGSYLDAGIHVEGPDAETIVIQGNRIHHPRYTSNNWTQVSPYFSRGGSMSTHPQGPDAIRFDEITRGRHVIRWNDIESDFEHMFYDGLLAAEPKGNGFVCDGDIYGNRISHCWDDGIEAERGERNVRIWGNHFSKMIKCISAGYIWGGPLYVFRNVAEDLLCPNEMPKYNGGLSPFKGHPPCFMPPPQEDPKEKRDGVVFVYHNTLLPGVKGSIGTAAGWVFNAWHLFTYDTPTVRLISRNNLWITRPYPFYFFAANPQKRNFAVRDFQKSYYDQDYDLHNGSIEPTATEGKHTLEKDPRFRQGHGEGSAGLYQLEKGTPGVDDALRLPNFNDDARGAGPDCGAHENGSPPMRFGRVLWEPAAAKSGGKDADAMRTPVQKPSEPRHVVVFHRPGTFAAWPANGGLWTWDEGGEVLLAFCTGAARELPGHNIVEPYTNALARSRDGGLTWSVEEPTGYYQPGDAIKDAPGEGFRSADAPIIRCTATGYHGGVDTRGGWLFSTDRGRYWRGPFRFAGLADAPQLHGWEITTRTDYLLSGVDDGLFLMSARKPDRSGTDRVFCARTRDGGQHFEFLNWVIGPEDRNRAVMPATVRCSPERLVTALRRRVPTEERNWIDVCHSDDNGRSWKMLGRIADTGKANGNPPALLRLRDGRLCCAYGVRHPNRIAMRLSRDEGQSWGDEQVLRDEYRPDKFGDADLGYPRLFQRPDGRLVVLYYWCAPTGPETIIAATIWSPPEK